MKMYSVRLALIALLIFPFLSMGMGRVEIDNYTQSDFDQDKAAHKISDKVVHWTNFDKGRVGNSLNSRPTVTLLNPVWDRENDKIVTTVVDFVTGIKKQYTFSMSQIGFSDVLERNQAPEIIRILNEDGKNFALMLHHNSGDDTIGSICVIIIQSLESPTTLYLNAAQKSYPIDYEGCWYLIDDPNKQVSFVNDQGEIIPVPENKKKNIANIIRIAEKIHFISDCRFPRDLFREPRHMNYFMEQNLSSKLAAATTHANPIVKSSTQLISKLPSVNATRKAIEKYKRRLAGENQTSLEQDEANTENNSSNPNQPQAPSQLSALKIMGIGSLVVGAVAAVSAVAYVVYNKIKEYRAKKKSKQIA